MYLIIWWKAEHHSLGVEKPHTSSTAFVAALPFTVGGRSTHRSAAAPAVPGEKLSHHLPTSSILSALILTSPCIHKYKDKSHALIILHK